MAECLKRMWVAAYGEGPSGKRSVVAVADGKNDARLTTLAGASDEELGPVRWRSEVGCKLEAKRLRDDLLRQEVAEKEISGWFLNWAKSGPKLPAAFWKPSHGLERISRGAPHERELTRATSFPPLRLARPGQYKYAIGNATPLSSERKDDVTKLSTSGLIRLSLLCRTPENRKKLPSNHSLTSHWPLVTGDIMMHLYQSSIPSGMLLILSPLKRENIVIGDKQQRIRGPGQQHTNVGVPSSSKPWSNLWSSFEKYICLPLSVNAFGDRATAGYIEHRSLRPNGFGIMIQAKQLN
ncbi:hypothetical protein FA15DRAFT_694545 [Coprinopsis marcescibilis]|uniref:Uncharacterized protein n=1 Tax=Coprinopsis marcescibilis TaxID=230819 RepID=A0A5C3KUP1_COPMA|nr:hypothetical protein FA15DRAFT_694545 [Coprinopsis marcescibilis]